MVIRQPRLKQYSQPDAKKKASMSRNDRQRTPHHRQASHSRRRARYIWTGPRCSIPAIDRAAGSCCWSTAVGNDAGPILRPKRVPQLKRSFGFETFQKACTIQCASALSHAKVSPHCTALVLPKSPIRSALQQIYTLFSESWQHEAPTRMHDTWQTMLAPIEPVAGIARYRLSRIRYFELLIDCW